MKTYWFTIASGEIYQIHAERLRRSLEVFNIPLTIIDLGSANSRDAKRCKITGILNAPKDCERIVYLDADTIVLDPANIDKANGAWRIPWRISIDSSLPKDLEPREAAERLNSFYRRYDLPVFEKNGALEGVEWNSGVIVGERNVMLELAQEWAIWWDRLLDLFDGHFRRDQLSFRIAYSKTCLPRFHTDLPIKYNWVVSYFGINPNASILHRTMVRRVPWLQEIWEEFVDQKLSGMIVRTENQVFDIRGIGRGRPCLQRTTNVDLHSEACLLRQLLAFSQPGKILLCGSMNQKERSLPIIREYCDDFVSIDSIHQLKEHDLSKFDLVVFCGVDYAIPDELVDSFNRDTVFCFTGLHDMALYRYLYRYAYVRFLEFGFGLFSNISKIEDWDFTYPDEVTIDSPS